MASDRLTRQELSWLLAQEARSAAALLRKGVTSISAHPVPTISLGEGSSTLDALDDAVKTLASLQSGAATVGRRGRIDLAALLLELAPEAQLSLEPGMGTHVFGDESELRRILQVLVSMGQSGAGSPIEASTPMTVRRIGDRVRVTMTLGPDSSVSSRTEQAWLHRMAVRHGGTLHLEGGAVLLELPADDGSEQEVQELRKELAAAQEQGEAYARELAAMFTGVAAVQSPAQSNLPGMAALARSMRAALGRGGSFLAALADAIEAAHARGPSHIDELDGPSLARAVGEALSGAVGAGRCSVSASGDGKGRCDQGLTALVATLLALDAAIASDGPIALDVSLSPTAVTVRCDDRGQAPEAQAPSTDQAGRPCAGALAALELLAPTGGQLTLSAHEGGHRAEAQIALPARAG